MGFSVRKKVYYHDTDCGGVVYYANYLKYFEEARTEHFFSKGIDIRELVKRGIFFVVAGVDIKYKSPARYGDELLILSEIANIKSCSLEFVHKIKKGDFLIAECNTGLVMVDTTFKPTPIPRDILALLTKE